MRNFRSYGTSGLLLVLGESEIGVLKNLVNHLYSTFAHLGGFGLLAVGMLDSSCLFMPFGNDILLIAMTANRHARMPYYAVMATAGSVLGCFIVDVVSRKGGDEALAKRIPRRRLAYVKRRIKKSAGWALAFASMMPPPFPFTPFVIVAAALHYPRKKLLTTVALARFARFSIEGFLAIVFGRRILQLAYSPIVQHTIIGLLVIFIAGSAVSIYSWIKQSGMAASQPAPAAPAGRVR